MNIHGIERLHAHLLAEVYKAIEKYNAVPKTLDQCQVMQDLISKMSIGQLLTMANLGDRWTSLRLLSSDNEGTVYLNCAGLYGGMDLEGFIHT